MFNNIEFFTPQVGLIIGCSIILFCLIMFGVLSLLKKPTIEMMKKYPEGFPVSSVPQEFVRDFRKEVDINELNEKHLKYFDDEFTKKRILKNNKC